MNGIQTMIYITLLGKNDLIFALLFCCKKNATFYFVKRMKGVAYDRKKVLPLE